MFSKLISWFATGVFFGLWMYFDAKARKIDKPSTWFWIGLIFGLFGLATYWYWHVYPRQATARKKKSG